MARTTLDLNENLISKGMEVTGAPSKKALIENAVQEAIRARAREEFLEFLRSGEPIGMTPEELQDLRQLARDRAKRLYDLSRDSS